MCAVSEKEGSSILTSQNRRLHSADKCLCSSISLDLVAYIYLYISISIIENLGERVWGILVQNTPDSVDVLPPFLLWVYI